MEEQEVPTEQLHESIQEVVEEQKRERRWTMYVAISTALIAVFAAIASLMAGHHSNEALIQQIKASDQWAYYQAKGIKAEIQEWSAPPGRQAKDYRGEQDAIKKIAEQYEKNSESHLEEHVGLAKAVTFFQIAIAISAISVLTGRRLLWYISMLASGAGLVFFFIHLFS